MVKETNGENPKFKIGDIIRMSKDKNHFCKKLFSRFVWRSFCD